MAAVTVRRVRCREERRTLQCRRQFERMSRDNSRVVLGGCQEDGWIVEVIRDVCIMPSVSFAREIISGRERKVD